MTYTITSGQLHITVEADSPIEAAKKALHECGTVELGDVMWIFEDKKDFLEMFSTEQIITILGQTIL